MDYRYVLGTDTPMADLLFTEPVVASFSVRVLLSRNFAEILTAFILFVIQLWAGFAWGILYFLIE